MERKCIEQLYEWKNRSPRKPLILRGARQVGKTWLMKEFAQQAFKSSIYINFEDDERFKTLFDKDFNIERILNTIQLICNVEINSETILLFDEIQTVPRGITSLKYFCENRPDLPIIAAGSLLGIACHNHDSFPVGKVDFVNIYPLDFEEFLWAVNQKRKADVVKSKDWGLTNFLSDELSRWLKTYYYVGGMPEAVKTFVQSNNYLEVRRVQKQILNSYELDFSKHAPTHEVPRIRMVWHSILSQLSKENKKFIYGALKEGGRAKEFELAIQWLVDAGLVFKVSRCKCGELPLPAFEDFAAFKLYLVDIGLLSALGDLSEKVIVEGNDLFATAKGAYTEQYVCQQLKSSEKAIPVYYWSAESSTGEIDFLIQQHEQVIPIEVKAEENLKSKSLRVFVEKYKLQNGYRFSMSPYREQDWMMNYPLWSLFSILS